MASQNYTMSYSVICFSRVDELCVAPYLTPNSSSDTATACEMLKTIFAVEGADAQKVKGALPTSCKCKWGGAQNANVV